MRKDHRALPSDMSHEGEGRMPTQWLYQPSRPSRSVENWRVSEGPRWIRYDDVLHAAAGVQLAPSLQIWWAHSHKWVNVSSIADARQQAISFMSAYLQASHGRTAAIAAARPPPQVLLTHWRSLLHWAMQRFHPFYNARPLAASDSIIILHVTMLILLGRTLRQCSSVDLH